MPACYRVDLLKSVSFGFGSQAMNCEKKELVWTDRKHLQCRNRIRTSIEPISFEDIEYRRTLGAKPIRFPPLLFVPSRPAASQRTQEMIVLLLDVSKSAPSLMGRHAYQRTKNSQIEFGVIDCATWIVRRWP